MPSVSAKSIPPIDRHIPEKTETATFAMGCFWGPDARFGCTSGIIRTRVGYAGGTTPNPTYHNIGNHIETIQIDYDPKKINFSELLNIFWQFHDPSNSALRRQYTSGLFFHNKAQQTLIEQAKREYVDHLKKQIFTEIIPYQKFYLAEDYHQKYRLRQIPELLQEFTSIYPNSTDFINSTAVARVNGYVSGYGSKQLLEQEIDLFGLSSEAKKIIQSIVNLF